MTDPVQRAPHVVSIAHSDSCPVTNMAWNRCNCGLYQGIGKPLTRDGDHAATCPCHCNCDFGTRLARYLNDGEA